MGIIGIITDFGARGQHYVAEMKGVGYQINPKITLVDITHEITPYSILEAAYVLYTVVYTFPKDTIFICVVDPGVGSDRDIVVVELNSGHRIIGPDNGIFTHFAIKNQIKITIKITESEYFYQPLDENEEKEGVTPPKLREIPNLNDPDLRDPDLLDMAKERQEESKVIDNNKIAFPTDDLGLPDNENPEIFGENMHLSDLVQPSQPKEVNISTTFHGRDIMMPCAAHLSKGLDIYALGSPKESVIINKEFEAEVADNGHEIIGCVQYIDAFQNIVTNIPIGEFNLFLKGLPSEFEFKFNDRVVPLYKVPFFAGNSKDRVLLIEGSSGYLEISINQDEAAKRLNLKGGQKISIVVIHKGEVLPPDV